MPIFTGIPYPAIYDKNKNEIVNDVPSWWGEPLKNISSNLISDNVISDIKNIKKKDKLIIFNLLDIVFGHSFMRLEKLTQYIGNDDFNEYDFLVLIPFQLRYLIATFESELSVVEVKLPFEHYKNCFTSIDEEVKSIINKYTDVYCETLSYPQQESLKLGTLNLPIDKWVSDINKVVIVYREDRTVGITKRKQYQFYSRLISLLNRIDAEIYMIGDKDNYLFKGVNDLRVVTFSKTTDDLWNEACSGAITIGVHGSNMLIPSLCSSYNIEFVTNDKLYNFGQATSFLETLNQQETIQKYRYIYGDEFLSDIKPKLVYEIIKSIIVKMNYVFDAVKEEKHGDLDEVRKKYLKSNNANVDFDLAQKIYHFYVRVRRKLNI